MGDTANPVSGSSPPPPADPVEAPFVINDSEPLQVDTADFNDTDSVLTTEQLSAYTTSLSSSALNYPTQHGRRYHAFRQGSYAFPNDESEMDRLDLIHLVMTKAIGNKLFLAPISQEKTHKVLDIGTGTGIWAVEIGDKFPAAEVIGNDLSAIQPAWVPPNVKFEIDDVESPWVENKPYDFIFSRYMTCSIADWPKLVGNIFTNLNPGGWAEFQDFNLQWYSEDGSFKEEHFTYKWDHHFLEAADKMNRDPAPGPKIEGWMKDAGFQNVTHRRIKIPFGPWARDPHKKDLGMCNLIQALDGLEAFSLQLFCNVLGWDKDEVLVLLAKVRNELKTGAFHAQYDFHVVFGQKPEA